MALCIHGLAKMAYTKRVADLEPCGSLADLGQNVTQVTAAPKTAELIELLTKRKSDYFNKA